MYKRNKTLDARKLKRVENMLFFRKNAAIRRYGIKRDNNGIPEKPDRNLSGPGTPEKLLRTLSQHTEQHLSGFYNFYLNFTLFRIATHSGKLREFSS